MSKRFLIPMILVLCVLPASADQVTLDDAIIDGSACIGQDCVNGEAFSFDTLILKENNLRIYFNDTSSTSSFPSTDWRLVANDSSNGGRNRFSIEDVSSGTAPFTTMGGAPSDSLFVGENGSIGLGTSAPATDVHVAGGDTPTLRLEQTGALGWTPQEWDTGANEAGYFVRDATAQTEPLHIEAGAVDDAMVISAAGDVTIAGTLSQGSSRHIKFIQSIAAADILGRLGQLEVSRWQYRHDTQQSTHLGPMAEDFFRVFGLGVDNQHIAASDVAGVAIASVKALATKVEAQAEEMSGLKQDNADLRARVERIEALLAK